MKNKTILTPMAALTALLIVGCAKEKPYDEQYKEVKLLERSNIITEETVTLKNGQTETRPVEYLYVPMTLGTPMNVTDADPFYQGQEKLVRLAWSEAGLQVLEMERDKRFQDNQLNEYPVLTIPGDYKQFRCREDAYGECTNVEEEDTEKEWYQKGSFLPKFEDIEVNEVNELNIFTLSNGSCLKEEDSKVVDYELSAGVINIELETTYKVNSKNFFCFFRSFFNDQLSTNGFRVRKYFSLVRLDKLASPNYKAVTYPEPDHDTFGFFTREEKVLNGDFDRQRKVKKILMERWNPIRDNNELVYHLSPEYSKPENDFILQATKEAINTMNMEMSASNIPFTIKLVEQPDPAKAVSPGDLRYTSLVLIEDPLANGLLGYGPAVSNPHTGEIVKAHTNMYLGVLKSMTRWVYGAAVDLTEDKLKESNPVEQAAEGEIAISPEALSNLPSGLRDAHFPAIINQRVQALIEVANAANNDQGNDEEEEEEETPTSDSNQTAGNDQPAPSTSENDSESVIDAIKNVDMPRLKNIAGHKHHHSLENHSIEALQAMIDRRVHQSDDNSKAAIKLLRLKESGNLSKEDELMLKEQARLDRYAENNALAVEFFPIGGTSKVIYPELLAVPGIQTERGTLKKWDLLTDTQKAAAQKIIVKSSYKATLVHELGHNLGLRHNFMGSWDKDNFFTDEEARSLGMEAAPAYSSIMDYSFSEFNQLKALGKYDLAALRFGYAREIEVQKTIENDDGTSVVVNEFLPIKGTVDEFDAEIAALPIPATRKSYEFCTDENAGLSSICNRFDEGTTLVEVTKYLIKRYNDYYKYRNFRDGRLDFSAYDLPGYVFGRKREFTRIRDVIEEYEFFAEIFSPELMAQGCSPQEEEQFPVCRMIRDRKDAVETAGNFFMDVLKTPDHLCALANPEQPNVIVEYRKLADIYDGIKHNIDHVTTSCFDAAVKNNVANPQGQGETPKVVIGETGKFFNGFKDTDPEYKYVTDRFVLGTWADKVMAFDALFRRTWGKANTDRGHMALMDIPTISEKAQGMIGHFVLGKPLNELSSFTMEDGRQFTVPYAISTDYTINTTEDNFSWIRDYLNLPTGGGKGTFVSAALHQARSGVDFGVDFEDDAFASRNLVAVHKTNGWIAPTLRNPNEEYFYDDRARTTYSADGNTPLAQLMLRAINNIDTLETAGVNTAFKILNLRTATPQPPATLAPEDQVFWINVEMEVIDLLIGFAENQTPLNEPFILQNFGPQVGGAILAVYAKGADHIKGLKEAYVTLQSSPAADATDIEKSLYDIPIEVLREYAVGLLDRNVVDFYKEQIRRLPNFLKVVGK